MNQEHKWKKLGEFVDIISPWLRLIGEKLEDNEGNLLEYWRVEKADSVVIITIHNNRFIFPRLVYRPGVGNVTLDFPGGRIPPGQEPVTIVPYILERELGIIEADIQTLKPINSIGWDINSSFSNQKLYGFLAELSSNIIIDSEKLGATYPINSIGIKQLLKVLNCLQCRGLLLQLLTQENWLIVNS